MANEMASLRDYYGVPAKRGGRVAFTWDGRREGTILSAREHKLYEMSRLEGDEIKGEHLRDLEAKGYEIVRHSYGDAGPGCFWCTINLLIGGLPDRNPSQAGNAPPVAPLGARA